MYCKNCGKFMNDDDPFCPSCGTPNKAQAAEQAEELGFEQPQAPQKKFNLNLSKKAKIGIIAAFVFLLLLYLFCYLRRRQLDNRALLTCALLVCVAVPFLLPHMHDRYFFIADVLSVAFAFVCVRLVHVPVCVSFGSLMGYHAYLTGRWFLDKPQSMAWGAAALALVLLLAVTAVLFI